MRVWVVLERVDYEEWTVRGVSTTPEGASKIAEDNYIYPGNLDIQEASLSD